MCEIKKRPFSNQHMKGAPPFLKPACVEGALSVYKGEAAPEVTFITEAGRQAGRKAPSSWLRRCGSLRGRTLPP